MSSISPSLQCCPPCSNKLLLNTSSPYLHNLKGLSPLSKSYHNKVNSRSIITHRCIVSNAANITAGQSEDPRKLYLDRAMDAVKSLTRNLPQPVKSFPWNRAFGNFLEIILQLVYAVAKYLCVPLLAISSLSEMSYCAHERKMVLIPIPLLAGFAVAGVLNDATLEVSPELKESEFPWHLLLVAIFFTLLKLPGPYYPYWGRIFLPHFANGGLWRTLWFALLWYRKHREAPKAMEPHVDETQYEKKP